MSLQPFFCYFGAKWQLAPRYPAPRYPVIIEPFAGSAGYATRHHRHQVILIEKDPGIAAAWRFLLSASVSDIMSMPIVDENDSIVDLGPKHLIGRWLQPSRPKTGSRRGGRQRETKESETWSRCVRARLASQVDKIRHWQIVEGDYSQAPDIEATWFIDPPYIDLGKAYACSSRDIDFEHLASWCRGRRGQVIVCENEGASWLPFAPFTQRKGERLEVIWTNDAA